MLEVEKVLSIPKTVFAGIKALKNKKIKKDLLEEELTRIKDRLRALDKEQEQLLQWALSGFTKETIIRENEKINQIRDELKKTQ